MKVIAIVPLPAPMPMCWDNEENWREWCRLNVLACAVGPRTKGLDHFCGDCTEAYSKKMIAAGRCAYPDPATRKEKVIPRVEV